MNELRKVFSDGLSLLKGWAVVRLWKEYTRVSVEEVVQRYDREKGGLIN